MCGIDGFFSPKKEVDTSQYYLAHRLLSHRGPDDEGFLAELEGKFNNFRGDDTIENFNALPHIKTITKSKLILGHRRLAIIELTHYGHQPMSDESGNYFITYNGEIFNYLELREELKKLGYKFLTNSDTEVILKAYIHWGTDAFNKFNGMWAFAIYDLKNNTLILSRDRFGVKPLYFSIQDDAIYFASEMKFLKKFINRKFTLNTESVLEYINRCYLNFSQKTFWNEINELEPGHFLVFHDDKIEVKQYWNFTPRVVKIKPEEALEQFSYLFEDSLKLRMRSDVEVGTLLSGGLDSTLIVCGLNKLGFIKNGNFKSFSAVFDDERFSEKKYISDTINIVPLKPYFISPRAEEVTTYLDKILYHLEEPFRSLSVYSQFLIYENIKRQTAVKVLLNGQGGDELFGGYTYHYYYLGATLMAKLNLIKLYREMKFFKEGRKVYVARLFYNLLKNLPGAVFYKNYFNKMLFSELKTSALREYLKYDDRTSMAFGLEARTPFLDYRLVEFAFSLDVSFKINNFVNKKIVRDYAKEIIPESVLNRNDKTGFISPQEVWQKTVLKYEMENIFSTNKELLRFLSAKDMSKYKNYWNDKNNNWPFVWRLFCLSRWLKVNQLI